MQDIRVVRRFFLFLCYPAGGHDPTEGGAEWGWLMGAGEISKTITSDENANLHFKK